MRLCAKTLCTRLLILGEFFLCFPLRAGVVYPEMLSACSGTLEQLGEAVPGETRVVDLENTLGSIAAVPAREAFASVARSSRRENFLVHRYVGPEVPGVLSRWADMANQSYSASVERISSLELPRIFTESVAAASLLSFSAVNLYVGLSVIASALPAMQSYPLRVGTAISIISAVGAWGSFRWSYNILRRLYRYDRRRSLPQEPMLLLNPATLMAREAAYPSPKPKSSEIVDPELGTAAFLRWDGVTPILEVVRPHE